MARVLLTIAEVGVAIEVQERLERAGHAVAWDSERRGGRGSDAVDVVIIPGGNDLGARIDGWRAHASVPAIVVLGAAGDEEVANRRGVVLLVSTERLSEALSSATARRFGTAIGASIARAALSIPAAIGDDALAAEIIRRGRSADEAIVRLALEPRRTHYVSTTPACDSLHAARRLDIPEIELARACTGAVTLETAVARSSLTALEAGQRVWALACAGALRFDREPVDESTPERRKLGRLRAHIQTRAQLSLPTAYDVLDLTRGAYVEDIEEAVAALGYRYAPPAIESVQLAELRPEADKIWQRILEARAAIYYEAGQKQLNAYIDRHGQLSSSWGRKDIDAAAARASFERGQAALSAGETFKALSDMAAAARNHPRHPVYEAYLAWTRYRSEVARGADRSKTARIERKRAESASLGRRPFAQALVAIGLLCVADGDRDAARWHLGESLALNPELPAAKMILRRL